MARPHPGRGTGTSRWDAHLEDAVHDDGQRAVPRVLGHFEHVEPPLVGVLQLLGTRGTEIHGGLALGTPRSGGSPLPGPTLASSASWSVRTPKRGMPAAARLELCVSFLTPLIWDMGRFLRSFSLSLASAEGISTSCCLSGVTRGTVSRAGAQIPLPASPWVTLRTGTGHTVTIWGAAALSLTPIHRPGHSSRDTRMVPTAPVHQYTPVCTSIPSQDKSCDTSEAANPTGTPGNPPCSPHSIPFLHKKQVGPSAGTTPGTPQVPRGTKPTLLPAER